MKYSKGLHDQLRVFTSNMPMNCVHWVADDKVAALLDEIERQQSRITELENYIKALESEPIRSKSVIKRLKVQSGVEK